MSSAAKRALVDPVVDDNPVTLHVLGICSALAVTTSLLPSLYMCLALTVVAASANAAVSMIRHVLPSSIRIIVQMTIIASLVIVVDESLQAFARAFFFRHLADGGRVCGVFHDSGDLA